MNGIGYACDGCGRPGAVDRDRNWYECPVCRWLGFVALPAAAPGYAVAMTARGQERHFVWAKWLQRRFEAERAAA